MSEPENPIFLGYMLNLPSKDEVFSTVQQSAQLRRLARQIFGLSKEQSEHPKLCFEEAQGLLGCCVPRLLLVWSEL